MAIEVEEITAQMVREAMEVVEAVVKMSPGERATLELLMQPDQVEELMKNLASAEEEGTVPIEMILSDEPI